MRSMFLYRMHYKSINSVFQGRFEVSIYLAVATLIVNTESHKQGRDRQCQHCIFKGWTVQAVLLSNVQNSKSNAICMLSSSEQVSQC